MATDSSIAIHYLYIDVKCKKTPFFLFIKNTITNFTRSIDNKIWKRNTLKEPP